MTKKKNQCPSWDNPQRSCKILKRIRAKMLINAICYNRRLKELQDIVDRQTDEIDRLQADNQNLNELLKLGEAPELRNGPI
jgi:hypothetical protein